MTVIVVFYCNDHSGIQNPDLCMLIYQIVKKICSNVSWSFACIFCFCVQFVNHFVLLYVLYVLFLIRNGHMLTHRNKKPYECKAEGCGKSYCDARSLRRHTENHHSTVATAPTTPNQSISSTGPLGGLSLSPATASGKTQIFHFAY